ncbi:hypothetical protein BDV23DRAFT_137284 [Aspergillus alliaceus]|uniref:Uncharacterized protein n=1 Tax=Petromyces alliaceus TaxID=209559 RepID=A0A5N7BY94_PETAA|nr:hypothetical protein BDV23DRAFT_137284 [Aspergillus alliaceus]
MTRKQGAENRTTLYLKNPVIPTECNKNVCFKTPHQVAAQEWISKGVQLVKASLDDIASLPRACLPRSLRHFRRY